MNEFIITFIEFIIEISIVSIATIYLYSISKYNQNKKNVPRK
jgi:hypothetical protein